ncbi:MAG TPA: sigma-70 family RNA polymerase sigma factor [Gemmataceae bacterium]|nr:sigma-70 family RNA polymerase sigma factor [Gemmataceae bacterium]
MKVRILLAEGAAAALDDLLRRCANRLEGMARQMLRRYPAIARWEETGDVLQNALVRLVRALREVSPAATREFFGLAAEQLRRVLLDLARHYRGAHGLDRNHASGFHAPGGPVAADPAPGLADLDWWAAFHEAVEHLPAEDREVFMLTFYHGWEQKPIAELFGVDERSVRRRWKAVSVAWPRRSETDHPRADRSDRHLSVKWTDPHNRSYQCYQIIRK